MSTFRINANWVGATNPKNELDASLASLNILLDDKNLTAYRTSQGREFNSVRVPTYYLAEWMAENWWALLYEPRKKDDLDQALVPDDEDFLDRHSISAAEHGFVLPSIRIVPVGRAVRVSATPRKAEFADAEFKNKGQADISRPDVEATFERFLSGTARELERHGISGTPFDTAWQRIKDTSNDEREFCELIGALGLCPYFVDDTIADAIDRLIDTLGSRATRDFCLAVPWDAVVSAVRPVQSMLTHFGSAPQSNLLPLSKVELPIDDFSKQSWTRGLTVAMRTGFALEIATMDDNGTDKFFDRLHVDTTACAQADTGNIEEPPPFAGAVERDDTSFRTALLQPNEGDRRFAAARSVYLAMVSEGKSRRLITQARTRDQQASRQFSAELLVPRAYLRAVAEEGVLHEEQVREIARRRKANPNVVRYQANNTGIQIDQG